MQPVIAATARKAIADRPSQRWILVHRDRRAAWVMPVVLSRADHRCQSQVRLSRPIRLGLPQLGPVRLYDLEVVRRADLFSPRRGKERRMRLRYCWMLAGALASTALAADTRRPYQLLETVAGPEGGYDYASVDERGNRVFVGRSYGVMAFDPKSRSTRILIRRDEVAAVLLIPGTRLMLTTNNGSRSATLLDRDSGAVKAEIETGEEPDGAAYDPATGRAFVMNGGSADISVIDVAAGKAIGRIAVGGTPEGAVADGKGRLFVNIEDANAIAVIDIGRGRVVRRYRLAGCEEPTGIAFDRVSNLLISACRNGVARLVDARTGAQRGGFRTGARPDGSLFDPRRRIGFVPALDGTVTVYALSRAGKVRVIQRLRTREGARTAAYDGVRDRLYLPQARVERDAQGKYLRAETDFHLLVVGR
jgi:YVTN family beta-propeller protein